jgi:hypothetical protein
MSSTPLSSNKSILNELKHIHKQRLAFSKGDGHVDASATPLPSTEHFRNMYMPNKKRLFLRQIYFFVIFILFIIFIIFITNCE